MQSFVEAILCTSEDGVTFYDIQEQSFLYLPDGISNDDNLEAIAERIKQDPERYRRMPAKHEMHEYSIVKQFVEMVADEGIHRELVIAIQGSGAFLRFKQAILYHGIEQQWYTFRDTAFREVAIQWCKRQGIAYDE